MSLLLRLELGSRYYERREFGHAAATYLQAAHDFPQFPETWIRLSLCYQRLAADLVSQDPRLLPQVVKPRLLEYHEIVLARRSGCYLPLTTVARLGSRAESEPSRRDFVDRIALHVDHLEELLAEANADTSLWPRHALGLHFAHAALGAAVMARRRTQRPWLLYRSVAVQSERVYFWDLLFSRYKVRQLATLTRTVQLLANLQLAQAQAAARSPWLAEQSQRWDVAETADPPWLEAQPLKFIAQSTNPVNAAVDRVGTGWRAPLYFAEFNDRLHAEISIGTTEDEGSPLSGPGAMRVLVGIGWSRPWGTRFAERNSPNGRTKASSYGLADGVERARGAANSTRSGCPATLGRA